MLPNRAITHFAGPVQVPGGPTLLRVTAPRLRPEEALDRLVLTAIHLPRRHRVAGLARRRTAGRAPSTAKLRFLGDTDMPPADKVIIDLGDLGTAFDAAKSLVFHDPELLTLMNDPADTILNLITDLRLPLQNEGDPITYHLLRQRQALFYRPRFNLLQDGLDFWAVTHCD